MRRRDVSGFSMSFLDLLTCGLGAMLLLFILSEQSQQEEILAKRADVRRIDSTIREMQEQGGPTDFERLAAWSEAGARQWSDAVTFEQSGSDVRNQFGLHVAAERMLILVDVSGSMSRYYPETKEFDSLPSRLRAAGPKWQATQEVVAELLTRAVGLQEPNRGFRVHRLSDDLPERPVTQPIYPLDDSWAQADVENIAAAQSALASTMPGGGSNHDAALTHALNCSTASTTPLVEPGADTIVIITDGLPNHGPVSLAGHPEHPGESTMEWVPGASRLDRKNQVMRRFLARLQQAAAPPTVHVIVMPWPDDSTMMQFALELAAPTGGSVVALPVPLEDQ